MDHTAHHLDVTIPLYQLRSAQSALESVTPFIIVQDWHPSALLQNLKTCRLYDYREHRWLDYSGTPLSDSPAWLPGSEARPPVERLA
jgi:omega-6 fatty acid desaturase (delta-12 desaturase)